MICTSLHLYASLFCHDRHVTWLNSRLSQPASPLCAVCRQLASFVSENLGEVSCTECTCQGNDFQLITAVKMETRHRVEGSFGNELSSICNHCGVMAALSRKTLKKIESIFCVFFAKNDPKMTPYGKIFKILFGKDSSRHWSPCCVQISLYLADGIGKIVHTVRAANPIFGWSLASSRILNEVTGLNISL